MPSSPTDESWRDQHGFSVRFEWGAGGATLLSPLSTCVVVVDVLSFTTAVTMAVERDGSVFPYPFRGQQAAEFAAARGAILAGERGGSGISLSPGSMRQLPFGSSVVLPSPNGAECALAASLGAAQVIAGSLRNARSVADYLKQVDGVVSVIAAGERWPDGSLRPAFEDLAGAGAILSALARDDSSPEARAAVAAYSSASAVLQQQLQACVSGRELVAKGFEEDVMLAGEIDVTNVVPRLVDGQFVNAGHTRHT